MTDFMMITWLPSKAAAPDCLVRSRGLINEDMEIGNEQIFLNTLALWFVAPQKTTKFGEAKKRNEEKPAEKDSERMRVCV